MAIAPPLFHRSTQDQFDEKKYIDRNACLWSGSAVFCPCRRSRQSLPLQCGQKEARFVFEVQKTSALGFYDKDITICHISTTVSVLKKHLSGFQQRAD